MLIEANALPLSQTATVLIFMTKLQITASNLDRNVYDSVSHRSGDDVARTDCQFVGLGSFIVQLIQQY